MFYTFSIRYILSTYTVSGGKNSPSKSSINKSSLVNIKPSVYNHFISICLYKRLKLIVLLWTFMVMALCKSAHRYFPGESSSYANKSLRIFIKLRIFSSIELNVTAVLAAFTSSCKSFEWLPELSTRTLSGITLVLTFSP